MKLPKLILYLAAACLIMAAATPAAAQTKKEVADKPGMTVKGIVHSDGRPLAGVVVSDGYEVTATDKHGRYWLHSAKKNGYVFISIPSGYEVPADRAVPLFWADLETPAGTPERHDFALVKTDNDDHIMLAVTDMHFANLCNDIEQFCTTFLPGVQEFVKNAGKPVYTLNTGDMSFDLYWYSQRYCIDSYKKTLNIVDYPTPVFHAIGNHDHDGSVPCSETTDFDSAERYRKAFGPTYYSFNIGKVHYVVLDNIIYLNEPGGKAGENIAGSRNYIHRVSSEQLEWLEKDLALVKDKSAPVVVGMHASAYRYSGTAPDLKVISKFSKPEYSAELTACFDGFTDVHYITGHTHSNYTTYVNDNLTEHNMGAVSGSWWFPGTFYYQNICPDSSPGGYGVFEVSGKDMSWYYNSIDGGSERQFRTLDMNEVRNYYNGSEELVKFVGNYPERRDFRKIEDDIVYVNVWNWAPDWTVTVTENGRELEVVHEISEDPLYAVSFELPKISLAGSYPKSYAKRYHNHIFKVKASGPGSTLEVRVTDRFGRTYSETMERPKAFGPDMK